MSLVQYFPATLFLEQLHLLNLSTFLIRQYPSKPRTQIPIHPKYCPCRRRGKIPVTVPKEFFKREKNRELLRLPKIPSLRASMPASSSSTNQLSHAEVLAFREALAKLQGAHASERARDDYRRAKVDCRKFRLDKLMPKSRPVFREALKSYMSTSKGAKEAATKVATKSLGQRSQCLGTSTTDYDMFTLEQKWILLSILYGPTPELISKFRMVHYSMMRNRRHYFN